MNLGVIGGGAWGTALAQVASAGGEGVLLWAMEPDVVDAVNARHENAAFLAGIPLNPSIRATGELNALDGCGALLVVTPAQHMRSVLEWWERYLGGSHPQSADGARADGARADGATAGRGVKTQG